VSRRLEALQWFALFGGALAWTAQLVIGFGVGQAACAAAGRRWGIGTTAWEATATGIAAFITVLAAVSAFVIVRETRDTEYDGIPPGGRRRFFAIASAMANVLFLAIIVNTGIMAVYQFPCRQS
jgi:hypothetical protein